MSKYLITNLMEMSMRNPKKHNYNFCMDCNKEMLIDNQNSILVCMNCGLCEYYQVYVRSYNHTMKPLRSRCIYI